MPSSLSICRLSTTPLNPALLIIAKSTGDSSASPPWVRDRSSVALHRFGALIMYPAACYVKPCSIQRANSSGVRLEITERVELLRAQPELVLDRLAETRSVWNAADVEREVRSMLDVRDGY